MSHEAVLTTIPGGHDREQLVVVLRSGPQGSQLVLKQQTWGQGVGWYDQSSVEIEPQQVQALRMALGRNASGAPAGGVAHQPRNVLSVADARHEAEAPEPFASAPCEGFPFRIVRAS